MTRDIKYADRGWNIPWKPKKERVSDKDLKVNGGVAFALTIATCYKFLQGLNPSVAATLFFSLRIYKKLDPYYVVESEYDDDSPQKTAKLMRTCGLVFGFLAAGLSIGGLLYSTLNFIAYSFSLEVPFWFVTRPISFLNIAAIIATFLSASFYR